MKVFKIGLDDTDTSFGYCTTYIATLLIEEVIKNGFEILDFPYLIRLNPYIPYKTRGNASVSFEIKANHDFIEKIISKFEEMSKELKDERQDKPNPVIAIYEGEVDKSLNDFYHKSLVKEIKVEEAIDLAKKLNIKYYALKSERGLIGALAAIGADLKEYTYELLSYRNPSEKSKLRELSYEKVKAMNEIFKDYTFQNLDEEKKRILITPHGKDPVIVGIRGKDPDKLVEAYRFLNIDAERWIIFKTNQGTDVHLKVASDMKCFDKYSVIYERCKIIKEPKITKGGHVIIEASINNKRSKLLVYRESGEMNKVARLLKEGDEIIIGGGIKDVEEDILIINSERIEILSLKATYIKKRPPCPRCGVRMKSNGIGKGLKCEKCNVKIPFEFNLAIKQERPIKEGQVFIPPPRARRHLTKPIEKENLGNPKQFSLKYFFSKYLLLHQKSIVNFS